MKFITVQPNSSGRRGKVRINLAHIIAYEPSEDNPDQLTHIYLTPGASGTNLDLEVREPCLDIDSKILAALRT